MFPLPTLSPLTYPTTYPTPISESQQVFYPHYLLTYKGEWDLTQSTYLYIDRMYAVCFEGSNGPQYVTMILKDVSHRCICGEHPRTGESVEVLQCKIREISEFTMINILQDDLATTLYYGDEVYLQCTDAPISSENIIFAGVNYGVANFIVSRNMKFAIRMDQIGTIKSIEAVRNANDEENGEGI